jgi:hypothetical protein
MYIFKLCSINLCFIKILARPNARVGLLVRLVLVTYGIARLPVSINRGAVGTARLRRHGAPSNLELYRPPGSGQ